MPPRAERGRRGCLKAKSKKLVPYFKSINNKMVSKHAQFFYSKLKIQPSLKYLLINRTR